MTNEKYILVVCGAGIIDRCSDLLVVQNATADIYVGPPPIVIDIKREPFIPNLDIKLERESKRRDWEQRDRKRRRK